MQKNKLLLVFPDGVGIRNYLYSGVFNEVESDLVLFHNFSPGTVDYLRKTQGVTADFEIPPYKESPKEKFFRELICLSRLKYYAKKNNNPTSLTNWNWEHTSRSFALHPAQRLRCFPTASS